MQDRNELHIPTLDYPDLAEWLTGAGYEHTHRLVVRGDTHHTYVNVGKDDGTPDIVGVIVTASGEVVTRQYWENQDHGYDDSCDCHVCVEVRAEGAALRRAGR